MDIYKDKNDNYYIKINKAEDGDTAFLENSIKFKATPMVLGKFVSKAVKDNAMKEPVTVETYLQEDTIEIMLLTITVPQLQFDMDSKVKVAEVPFSKYFPKEYFLPEEEPECETYVKEYSLRLSRNDALELLDLAQRMVQQKKNINGIYNGHKACVFLCFDKLDFLIDNIDYLKQIQELHESTIYNIAKSQYALILETDNASFINRYALSDFFDVRYAKKDEIPWQALKPLTSFERLLNEEK